MNNFIINKFFYLRINKNLVLGFTKRAGKNCFGRKTIFTQSGGYKLRLNSVDYKRILPFPFVLISIKQDSKVTGFLGLVCYLNGFFSYILLPHLNDYKFGEILPGFVKFFVKNASTFLKNVPNGNFVHHVELVSGNGAKLCRAAGCSAFIIGNDKMFSFLKMRSGWLIKIFKFNICVIGIVSNINHHIKNIGKAGNSRKLGIRPKVRGVAMNPCDHPHGGGEGTGSPPRAHKTPWGKLCKSPTKVKKEFLLKKKRFKVFKKK